MPQVSQLQGNKSRNIEEGQVASSILGDQLADMRKRQATQSKQLGALRQMMTEDPNSFKGSSVSVSALNDVIGSNKFYKDLAGKDTDLTVEEAAKDANLQTREDFQSALNQKIQESNDTARNAMGGVMGAVGTVAADIGSGGTRRSAKEDYEWLENKGTAKEKELFKQALKDNKELQNENRETLKALMNKDDKDLTAEEKRKKEALDGVLKSEKFSSGSSVKSGIGGKLGWQQSVEGKFKSADGEAKNTLLLEKDLGVNLKDEIKKDTRTLMRQAQFADIASGFDPMAMQNNRYRQLATDREQWKEKLAALQQSRNMTKLEQGSMKFNGADYSGKASQGNTVTSNIDIENNVKAMGGSGIGSQADKGKYNDNVLSNVELDGNRLKKPAIMDTSNMEDAVDRLVKVNSNSNERTYVKNKLENLQEGSSFKTPSGATVSKSGGKIYVSGTINTGVLSTEATADLAKTKGTNPNEVTQKKEGKK